MDQIRLLFEDNSNFDELCIIIQDKTVIDIIRDFLHTYHINNIPPRNFLVSLLIYKFPKDIIGNITEFDQDGYSISTTELDQIIIDRSKELLDYIFNNDIDNLSPTTLRAYMINFNNTFENWKKEDKLQLINSMFYSYHTLSVDIMNCDEEFKSTLSDCQSGIITQAHKIGGDSLVQQIRDFKPVIINTEELLETYNKAFWDLTTEEYNKGDFMKVFAILEHIKTQLKSLNPSESEYDETIDIPFIQQQVNHNIFGASEIMKLQKLIVTYTYKVQSPDHDHLTEILKNKIDDDISLPDFLKEIAYILQLTCDDILKLKMHMTQ